MASKHLRIKKASLFVFSFVSLLLCMNIAQGATLDVYVVSGGQGVGNAVVFVDGYQAGTTSPNGSLLGINVSPGYHTVVVNWGGLSGSDSFTAQQSDSPFKLTIRL